MTPRVTNTGSNVQTCSIIIEQERGPPSKSWLAPYLLYLADGRLPFDPTEAQAVRKNAARYTIIEGRLFRRDFSQPLLIYVTLEEGNPLMSKLHEGICGSHVGGRTLSLRVLRAGYYWPTLK